MKKTLITLLALAGVASAATTPTLDDATLISDGSFTAPLDWKTAGLSVTLNFDVEKLQTLVDTVSSSNRPVILSLGDRANYSRDFRLAETWPDTCLYALGYTLGSSGTGAQNYTNWNTLNVNWDNVTGAALTMTATNGGGGTSAVFTFLESGEYKDYTIASSTLMWSDGGDIVTVSYNADIVREAYAWDGNAVVGSTMNQAVISVPEPVTATLSLLALAGLAARRRRK